MVKHLREGIIVITGAASGIGRATASALAEKGHILLLIDLNEKNLEVVVSELEAEQGFGLGEKGVVERVNWRDTKIMAIAADVSCYDDFHSAIKDACTFFHRGVSCLVNNAGIMCLGEVATQDVGEWAKMFTVNSIGVLNGMKSVLPGMKQKKSGTIINVSSISGFHSCADKAAYCGSKFAVHGMTETVRKEVASYNVRVCLVSPGVVATNLVKSGTTDAVVLKRHTEALVKDCGGYMLTSKDVAAAIVFILEAPPNVTIRELTIAPTHQVS